MLRIDFQLACRCCVSILVFVELALDAHQAEGQLPPSPGVSILVFVELALDVLLWSCGLGGWDVSILVFVELALDASGARKFSLGQHEFQSLFSWNLLLMACTERP